MKKNNIADIAIQVMTEKDKKIIGMNQPEVLYEIYKRAKATGASKSKLDLNDTAPENLRRIRQLILVILCRDKRFTYDIYSCKINGSNKTIRGFALKEVGPEMPQTDGSP